ncbi:MAG: type II toxin-antitoxin system ParD family antitoxin [Hyphomicrobiales bacterium]|nr:type II toxin-antitoxin system ParD family antitoxin [Nitratireductor sp.]MCC2097992.1 type II toxin-antitoxin system ParD family antitoxin [Hyphomicrobiales bacterium]
MQGTEKRTFSLPSEHAAFIDAKVRSGSYASGSEVIRAGLRALQERDAAIEKWLHEDVARSYDAVMSGKAATHSIDDVFKALSARHADKAGK